MTDTKTCVVCGAVFERPMRYSKTKWERRLTCGSQSCRARSFRRTAGQPPPEDTTQPRVCTVCGKPYHRTRTVSPDAWSRRTTCGERKCRRDRLRGMGPSVAEARKRDVAGLPAPKSIMDMPTARQVAWLASEATDDERRAVLAGMTPTQREHVRDMGVGR